MRRHVIHLDAQGCQRRAVTLVGSLLLFGCLPVSVFAQAGQQSNRGSTESHQPGEHVLRPSSDPHGFEDRFTESFQQRLNLSKEQKVDFDKIETEYKVMTIRRGADIRVAEVELAALLEEDPPDLNSIKQKVDTIGEFRTNLMMGRVESLLQLKNILKTDQYDRFRHMLRKRMERLVNHPSMTGH